MRPEVVFDHKGRRLPADPAALARILRCPPVPEAISYAIRRHGFILVRPVRNSLVLELEPSAVSILAAWATFFEVMERAPKRVVLAYPGNGGHRRYEIVSSDFAALRRIEELALAAGGLDLGHPRAGLSQSEGIPLAAHCVRAPSSKSGRVVSFRGRDGLAVRVRGDDRSQRSCRPVDAMSPLDDWMGRVLGIWRSARVGTRLPSSASLASLDLAGIVCGRAHLVDTSETNNPLGYWFRAWGPINSYKSGNDCLSLDAMPPGLMRENAIEDYQQAVAQGTPNYSVIRLRESSTEYSYSRLILPFAGMGQCVNRLLVLINERDLALEFP